MSSSRGDEPAGPGGLGPKGDYIFDVLQGLLVMTREDPDRMAMLTYLLEMAAMEADNLRQRP